MIGEITYTPVDLPEWHPLPTSGIDRVLRHVNHLMRPNPFESSPSTIARYRRLPFYADVGLIELTNLVSVPSFSKYVIYSRKAIRVVDWTVEPIYRANTEEPILLDASNVVSYLKFFSEYVFTANGQRYIIDDILDLPFINGYDHNGLPANLTTCIRKAQLTGVYQDGSLRVECTDLAGYNLYNSVIFVTPGGTVDWIVTDLLAEELPIIRRDTLV